ncbi:MAG: extracellular solute-binding protein, partial [Oscillospiraceae bacterium]
INMKRRLFSIALVIVLACGTLSACKKSETAELPDELTKVQDIFANDDSFADDANSEGGINSDQKTDGSNTLGPGGPPHTNEGNENLEGNTYTKGFPYVKDPLTLNRMADTREGRPADWNEMRFSQVYSKATNINIEWTIVPQGSLQEKVKIMMAAGNYPDILCALGGTFSDSEVLTYGSKNVLWDCSQSLKTYAPNLFSMMKQDPSIRTSCIEDNGSMYSLPYIQTDDAGHYWNINKKWLDNLGLSVPQTTEELERALVAFKNNDPDGDGINNQIPFASYCYLPEMFGPWGLYFEWNNSVMVDNNKKINYVFGMNEARSSILYWKNLKKQGLIDVPMVSSTIAEFNKKLQTGKVGCFLWNLTSGVDCLDYDMLQDYASVSVPKASGISDSLTAGVMRHSPSVTGRSSFIFNTCKNKEAALRWLDYFYSVDGNMFKAYLDVDYKYLFKNADGTLYANVPDGTNLLAETPGSIIAGDYSPRFTAAFGKSPVPKTPEQIYRSDYYKNAQKTYSTAYPKYLWPDICYTLDETKRLNKYKSYLTFDSGWYTVCAMIEGKSDVPDPSTSWNTWLNTLKKAGMDDYVAVQQEAYNRSK